MGSNKKLEASIDKTFKKMDEIVNEKLTKTEDVKTEDVNVTGIIEENNSGNIVGDTDIEIGIVDTIRETSTVLEEPEVVKQELPVVEKEIEETEVIEKTDIFESKKSSEPIVDEPKIVEPLVDEPAIVEPIVDEPAIVEPIVEELQEPEPETDNITEVKKHLKMVHNYSYMNCGRHFQNEITEETLKNFYDEFIVQGIQTNVDLVIIRLIEKICKIKDIYSPDLD